MLLPGHTTRAVRGARQQRFNIIYFEICDRNGVGRSVRLRKTNDLLCLADGYGWEKTRAWHVGRLWGVLLYVVLGVALCCHQCCKKTIQFEYSVPFCTLCTSWYTHTQLNIPSAATFQINQLLQEKPFERRGNTKG